MTDSDFFNSDWLKLQQEYWEQWSRQIRAAVPGDPPPDSLWAEVMEHCWRALSGADSALPDELMARMAAQGQGLFHLAELFLQNQRDQQPVDWAAALNDTFGQLRTILGGLAQSFTPVADEMLQSRPGQGFGRGTPEQQQAMAAALLNYQQAQLAYEQFLANFGLLVVQRMQQRLAEEGARIDSSRALYDLWIEVCEETYAEKAVTPEYARLYSGLINALMQVKAQMTQMLDHAFSAMKMPTSGDFKKLLEQRQADRRQLRALLEENRRLKEQLGGEAGKSTSQSGPDVEVTAGKKNSKKSPARKRVSKKQARGSAGSS